ncbi:MAG: 50S ribosomal protein L10 [Candidatus Kerfeldbacteria bacterium RIFCSPHIGHO2_12_FULL_48_17]|uniref:Large ribosomal subunit protein uL10 n=1 Tax=Candidatus Kerfeldbacteria bacterium RIFCSPHIGHO2_12_FULL_48_17 TaxID=1798542 RepID=A0A1G2B522_9BACT|nr:MAG: 50S ribosomal protein L10 [Candidatus Kerfeldbacteria bacterium RIFCSPHIGHO2_12_FULL_48_17]
MAKTRSQKQDFVKKLAADIGESKGIAFASYVKLTVKETEELRKKLREAGSRLVMSKKTLLSLALKDNNIELAEDSLAGPVTIGLGKDEVLPAKTLYEFAKTHKDQVKLVGGVFEGAFIGLAKVTALASLPSKQELLAKAVGSIKAPLSGLVNVLQGNLRGLVVALKAISEQKA